MTLRSLSGISLAAPECVRAFFPAISNAYRSLPPQKDSAQRIRDKKKKPGD